MLFHPPGHSDPSKIKSFGAVWAYYLEAEFRKLGVEVVLVPWMRGRSLSKEELVRYHETLDISGIDHILGLGIRYWSFLPPECGKALRKRLGSNQCLAQVHDASMLDDTPADVTFTHRDCSAEFPPGSPKRAHERHRRHTCLVGWAADADLCSPNQPEDVLQILVDHPTFTHSSRDLTLSVLLNLRELVNKPELWRDRFKAIRVRQLLDGAVVDVDVNGQLSVQPYSRKAIPYLEACKEYSRSHIFMVTHAETVGQTVIETATAGALVVSPERFIAADRLATVRHHEWSRLIRWEQVLPQIDVQASRSIAMENSWTKIARRIVDYFQAFDRVEVGWAK